MAMAELVEETGERLVKKKVQRDDCDEGTGKEVPETAPAGVSGAARDDHLRRRLVERDMVSGVVGGRNWRSRPHEGSLLRSHLRNYWRVHDRNIKG